MLDNYDSFTYNLVDYFYRVGIECIVKKNDETSIEEIENLNPKAIVLSPGPNTPNEAGILLKLIAHFKNKKPLLGICLGHQAIGMHFGYKLIKANLPMHGKTSIIEHQQHPIFENIPQQFEVMRYHSLLLQNDSKSTTLKTIAVSSENEIMAFVHESLPITGFQFHPESILTKNGLTLLKNWLKLNVINVKN